MTGNNKWLNALFMMVLLNCFLPSISRAADCLVDQPVTLNIPMQTINPSEKGTIGTVLSTYEISIPSIKYSCGSKKMATWFSEFVRGGMSMTNMANVYSTDIKGIGIRAKWPLLTGNSWVPGNYTCQGECLASADKMRIEIIQIGIAENGTIPGGPLLEVKISDNDLPDKKYSMIRINMDEVIVNIRSCSIIASSSNIDLGEYSLADINKSGFTGEMKDYSITLNCPNESSAAIRFEGKHAWGQGTGVLETDGSAKNVFVTLYTKKNTRYTELTLNEDINFGSASSFVGTREAKYGAEMTFIDGLRDEVTSGDVTSSVVYTLTIN